MGFNTLVIKLFIIIFLTSCNNCTREERARKGIYPEGIKPIAPYSPGVVVDNLLFISGQIGIDPKTSILVNDNIEKETHQVMKNLFQVVQEAGFEPKDIIKVTIYMSDIIHYEAINRVYGEYFKGIEILPVRESLAVKALPKNANIEISAIAIKK